MLTWQELSALLDYWQEFPPVHILLQGIAAGLGSRFDGAKKVLAASPELPNQVKSGEEMMGILQGSNIPFGVIHG